MKTEESRARFRYWLTLQTRWMDNDQYGHVNNAQYYSYIDSIVNKMLFERKVLDGPHWNAIGLVIAGALSRLIHLPPNIAAVTGVTLFAGFAIRNLWLALAGRALNPAKVRSYMIWTLEASRGIAERPQQLVGLGAGRHVGIDVLEAVADVRRRRLAPCRVVGDALVHQPADGLAGLAHLELVQEGFVEAEHLGRGQPQLELGGQGLAHGLGELQRGVDAVAEGGADRGQLSVLPGAQHLDALVRSHGVSFDGRVEPIAP